MTDPVGGMLKFFEGVPATMRPKSGPVGHLGYPIEMPPGGPVTLLPGVRDNLPIVLGFDCATFDLGDETPDSKTGLAEYKKTQTNILNKVWGRQRRIDIPPGPDGRIKVYLEWATARYEVPKEATLAKD